MPSALLDSGCLGSATFLAAIGLTTVVLWNAHRLAPVQLAGASAAVLAMLWLVGWIREREGAPQAAAAA